MGLAITDRGSMAIHVGDWVKVKPWKDIRTTLDEHGCLDGLVFMPEMVLYCGCVFEVWRRVEKTCVEGVGMCRFKGANVLLLRGSRCHGCRHGGCQKDCTLFWKEAWLDPVACNATSVDIIGAAPSVPASYTYPTEKGGRSLCQSSELSKATEPITKTGRVLVCWRDVHSGTYSLAQLVHLLLAGIRVRLGRVLTPRLGLCSATARTPDEPLNLEPGEWVEVKSREEIIRTLDRKGRNRGLEFTPLMLPFCGRRYRVSHRVDRMIMETTGAMRELRNTVALENVTCDGHTCWGGCPRDQIHFWREIWLKRVTAKAPDPAVTELSRAGSA